jgi:hypothetical protein
MIRAKRPAAGREPLEAMLKRLCVVVLLSIAFAYIESAVVVYLRQIFHPDGFSFPLKIFGVSPLWKRLLITEVGREAATLVLILTVAWLSGRHRQQRFAFFLTIFAVWDLFYYVWLKVLIDWPKSLMDWDILFLIPVTWAGPVLAPVLVSVTMLAFAVVILYRGCAGRAVRASTIDWAGFVIAALLVVLAFCIAGAYAEESDFAAHFHWTIFAAAEVLAAALFLRSMARYTRS